MRRVCGAVDPVISSEGNCGVSDSSQAGGPPRHSIRGEQLDSLALGRFDPDAIRILRSAQRSRRLLLLWTLLHLARSRPDPTGPLPPVDDAWRLLLRAESAAPGAVAELLSDPQAGTWIAHTLRRL